MHNSSNDAPNKSNSIKMDLSGKSFIIMGLANKWSIAWGIAQALHHSGARLAFTYAGNAFEARVKTLLNELSGDHLMYECDVRSDESIQKSFAAIKSDFGHVDGLVHSVAFANKNFMNGDYSEVTREAFSEALDISCYSFTAVAREVKSFLNPGSSMLTLSYYGAEKWVANYNIMGVAKAALEASVKYLAADFGLSGTRVNCISAGPIKTLSAMGISKFDYIGRWCMNNSPLQRFTTIEDVGNTALYLLSDLSSGVTGETIHVDCGYNIVGIKHPKAPDVVTTD
jgi:enoyl-[acyl-carrier protein] reductase I